MVVLGNILIIVIIDEPMIPDLPECYQGGQYQKKVDRQNLLVFKHKIDPISFSQPYEPVPERKGSLPII